MDLFVLKQLGLTNNEAKIYLALLEVGPCSAGKISNKSGLHRRSVYDSLNILIDKGLVSYILKNNIKVFSPCSPNRFKDILFEKQNLLDSILPDMLSFFESSKKCEETNFFKGREGLKSVFEDQLEVGCEILVIGASPLAYDILQFYFKWFDKKRVKHKIKTRVIFNKPDKNIKIPFSEVRFLPQKYMSPLAINIYGDKVAIILWSKNNPLAIVIKNKMISEGYKKYFEVMWRSSIKS